MAEDDWWKALVDLRRAQIVAAQGNHVDACRAAEEIVSRFPFEDNFKYEAAAVDAIASGVAGKTSSDGSDQQVAEYVNKCFTSLKWGRFPGYFDLVTNVIAFKANPKFASVGDDPRYSQFVESLSRQDENKVDSESQSTSGENPDDK